jgi:transposase
MGKGNVTRNFKRDAVAQIVNRGYPVAEVSRRLGVSQHLLYGWKKKFTMTAVSVSVDGDAQIRSLKRQLARVTEERDILKNHLVEGFA